MKVATFNINNINRRLPNLLRWLRAAKPDVVCLQELKSTDADFPLGAIEKAGYGAVWRGQKTWNGVAILARNAEPVLIRTALPGDCDDVEARYIEAAVRGIIVTSLYLPNGNPQPGPKFAYKLDWFRRLKLHATKFVKQDIPVVLAGDYNVAPTPLDIYPTKSWDKDALIQPKSRAAFESLVAQGWTDSIRELHPSKPMYTFWDYKRNRWPRDAGLRLDHLLLSPAWRHACSSPASTASSAAKKAPATTRRRGWCWGSFSMPPSRNDGGLPYPPADLCRKALIELRLVGAVRGLPHALVEPVGVLADQDTPAPGLDTGEDDRRRRSRGHRSFVTETPRAIGGDLLNILIRHRLRVDAHALQAKPRLQDFVWIERVGFTAALDLAGIGNDGRADVAGHHDRAFDMRRVQPEIVHQGFGEALYREFRSTIGGVRYAEADGSPEPVDAGGVDDVALVGFHQHRQENAGAEIDPAPADVEGLFPLLPGVGEQAAAAANAGIVEQQMNPVGSLLLGEFVAKAQQLIFDGNVGDMGGDAQALRQFFHLAQPPGFRHSTCRDIAHRDVAALGDQLPRKLAAHARAASGDDSDLSGKILHGETLTFFGVGGLSASVSSFA
jgi:exodeoxyribonuclease-3